MQVSELEGGRYRPIFMANISFNDLIVGVGGTSSAGTALNVQKLWATSYGTVIIPTSDTVVSGTTTNTFTGYTRGVTIVTPALESTGTATLKLIDGKGGTLISQAQDESVVAYYGTIAPMTTDMKWVCTANGTQSAAGTISFAVHYEK